MSLSGLLTFHGIYIAGLSLLLYLVPQFFFPVFVDPAHAVYPQWFTASATVSENSTLQCRFVNSYKNFSQTLTTYWAMFGLFASAAMLIIAFTGGYGTQKGSVFSSDQLHSLVFHAFFSSSAFHPISYFPIFAAMARFSFFFVFFVVYNDYKMRFEHAETIGALFSGFLQSMLISVILGVGYFYYGFVASAPTGQSKRRD